MEDCAILPIEESLNPSNPEANWLHKTWAEDGGEHHYLLCERGTRGHIAIIASAGSSKKPIFRTGQEFTARHDQTGRPYSGTFKVTKVVGLERIKKLDLNKEIPFFVFK